MRALTPDDPERVGSHALLARLGAGAVGVVYLARSPGGRPVAVKLAHPGPEARARLLHEIAAVRALSGAFTAPLVDAGEAAERPWLATAYLAGVPLREAIATTGPLPPGAHDALAAGLAEAVTGLHRAGVAHNDLQPANVLLTELGPRLLDLGQAAPLGTPAAPGSGTPGFLPPEAVVQQRTQPPGPPPPTQPGGADAPAPAPAAPRQDAALGEARDVFSLAAVLVHAATGAGPFGDGPPDAVLYRTLHADPYVGGLADPAVQRLLWHCLARDPAARPKAADVLDFFGARVPAGTARGTDRLPPPLAARIVSAAAQIPPPEAEPWRDAPAPGRRTVLKRTLIAAGGVAALAGGGTAAALLLGGGKNGELWRSELPDDSLADLTALGDAVYAYSHDLGTCALDARTGKQRWRNREATASTQDTLRLAGDVLVLQNSGTVQALDVKTGTRRWQQFISGGPEPAVAVPLGLIAVHEVSEGRYDRRTVVCDLHTGQAKWQFDDIITGCALAFDGNTAYVPLKSEGLYGVLEARDAATGRLRWRTKVADTASYPLLTPLVGGGLVCTMGGDGYLHAYAADTGRPRWKTPLSGGAGTMVRDTACAAIAGGAVYTLTGDGVLQCFDLASGKQRWRFPTANGMTQEISRRLAVAGDVAVVITRKDLYGLGTADGRTRWRRTFGDDLLRLPVSDGMAYLDVVGGIQTVDVRTGAVTRTLSSSTYSMAGSPSAAGGRLFFYTYPNLVVAVPARASGS
ncbi:serine/threonine-protein kinase [Actinomadura parmotrematis]|uniref:Serine/threonine-protein kinase n=1 Tax=Actinomadura parmotrematis TaxID=2864039 RepID=A0ABS7G2A2_9ACTN|nr:serine/threonine-protein kinase [Actinomadura parmotrematis]MBW8486845.1 serine/threonine-protein kinase [Actinomadura parmotrematis]